MNGRSRRPAGFTLIELLVVMAIIATLLTIAVPRYFKSLDRSKEAVLRQDLNVMRDAIDKYYSDRGKYPAALADLVTRKYIRAIPVDPLTGKDNTWVTVAPEDGAQGEVFDVHSGAPGKAADGTPYGSW